MNPRWSSRKASVVVLFSLDVRTLAGFFSLTLIRRSETNDFFFRLQIEIRPNRLKKFRERQIKMEGEREREGEGGSKNGQKIRN